MLRVWDPRTNSKIMKLKGHTDNVRTVLLNREGSLVSHTSPTHSYCDSTHPPYSSVCQGVLMALFVFGHWVSSDVWRRFEFMMKECGL